MDGGADSAWTKTPALAVGPDGTLAMTWYDRRDGPARACQHLYAAASADGGRRWSAPVRVSTQPSCPAAGGNGPVAARAPGGGDYSGLVAVGPGEFVAVWSHGRSGR
jgi:hypothetical protein